MRRIGISIPVFNRTTMLYESFEKVYDDPRIDQIVIVDDCSELGLWHEVTKHLIEKYRMNYKFFIKRNIFNIDCYKNKFRANSLSRNTFNIILDSDNRIDKDYIDRLFAIPEWDPDTLYASTFAMPQFDYRAFEGLTVTKENVAEYMDKPMFETALNTFNCFIHRDNYHAVFDPEANPVTSDSIYFCMLWLEAGKKIYFVPGLQYEHRVHDGSHYQNNNKRTPEGFHEMIIQKLKAMK